MKQEKWKPVKGWRGFYEVSSHGRVRSVARTVHRSNGWSMSIRERILKAGVTGGYPMVNLSGKPTKAGAVFVHVLVAEAFIPRPPGTDRVCHKDDNGSNNYEGNLYWGNASSNGKDAHRNGLMEGRKAKLPRGRKHYLYKVTPRMVRRIRRLRKKGFIYRDIGERVGVDATTACDVVHGKGRYGKIK